MNNNNIWGPSGWTFLHTITFNFPDNPSDRDKHNYYNFFNNLKYILPCEKCKKHYIENSKDLNENLDSKDDLVKWLIGIHNKVNELNGKKIWTYDEVYNKYEKLYNPSNTINNTIIFIIFIVVFVLIFFLFNIYGDKINCK